MSYILDALKRADADRQRGQVPGLHAQPASPGTPIDPGSPSRSLWLGAAGALSLGGLALLWWFWRSPPAPEPVKLEQAAPAAPAPRALPAEPVAPPAEPAPAPAPP
ncbi:MAG: hypothetical protein IAE92_07505, partial [Burkholderiaceae bacterium]|nr:hypothetical protein [Burkholderiaceae bacterium]